MLLRKYILIIFTLAFSWQGLDAFSERYESEKESYHLLFNVQQNATAKVRRTSEKYSPASGNVADQPVRIFKNTNLLVTASRIIRFRVLII